MTTRRNIVKGLSAAAASLGLPLPARAQQSKIVKFIPLGDIAILDPHRVAVKVTVHHAYMVFDTLFGVDEHYNVHPQMLEGYAVASDGLTWDLKLRSGLRFHDREPVRAPDVVASINRYGQVDPLGAQLLRRTNELVAVDDMTVRFRLKQPFPMLPLALGKSQPNMPAIMPERLARTPITTAINDMVGSGPFRYIARERNPGALHVYEKFREYMPRSNGTASETSGPKVVNIDRVEWHVIPDPSTAVAALRSGAMDWWERPTFDLLPVLQQANNVTVFENDKFGEVGALILNKTQPPFDNPAVCRAMFDVIDQKEFMAAIAGDERFWRAGVGCFAPNSRWASRAGLESLDAPIDYDKAKAKLREAGYKGERVVIMAGADIPDIAAASLVGFEAFKRAGLNVELQTTDWGTVIQRRLNRGPVSEGGWNCYFVPLPGSYIQEPLLTPNFRGSGDVPGNGYTRSDKLNDILGRWLDAPDDAVRQKLGEELQRQTRIDVPFVPTGNYIVPTAFNKSLTDIVPGPVIKFWGLKKGA